MAFENIVHDKTIEQIRRIEGLLAYAVEHNEEAEIRRLKALLDKVASLLD